MTDCIVVGGGPAGLTAALYLARFLRSVTVIDAADGRARTIPDIGNLSPFPDGISGRDLLDRMRRHAQGHGARMETGVVSAVERHGEVFRVTTQDQVTTARAVILACGVVNHKPPLSMPDHDMGVLQGLIRYCPVCDAYEIRDKRIAVLGNDSHGFREAQFLRHYSAHVTLVTPNGPPAVARDGIAAPDAAMTGLRLTDTDVVITLETGAALRFDTLYVALGTSARNGLASGLGLRLAEGGCIIVDDKQRTSIDRVFAIGDITDGLDQIAVAMGQAAVAATAIHNDLLRCPAL